MLSASDEEIYLEIHPYLCRVLSASRIFDSQADDLLNETWKAFFAKRSQFEGRSKLKTFIIGILINRIREHRRSCRRSARHVAFEDLTVELMAFDGNPEKALENRQTLALINEALTELTDEQREAFILREVEGCATDEICSELGVTPTHVGVLIFRAKRKLRQSLERQSNSARVRRNSTLTADSRPVLMAR
jgi:RNA polymerase sigma-70 factor (ECF subfamily)